MAWVYTGYLWGTTKTKEKNLHMDFAYLVHIQKYHAKYKCPKFIRYGYDILFEVLLLVFKRYFCGQIYFFLRVKRYFFFFF